MRGHFQQYFEIYNVTRAHHDKQIKCSVENELGTAMGLRSIEVKCKTGTILLLNDIYMIN